MIVIYKFFENIPNKESNIQIYSDQLHDKQKELGENNSMKEISDELATLVKVNRIRKYYKN